MQHLSNRTRLSARIGSGIRRRRFQICLYLIMAGPVYWAIALYGAQTSWRNSLIGRSFCAPASYLLREEEWYDETAAAPFEGSGLDPAAVVVILCMLWIGGSLVMVIPGGAVSVILNLTLFPYVSSRAESRARAEFVELVTQFTHNE